MINKYDYVLHQAKDNRKENSETLFKKRLDALAEKTGLQPETIKEEFQTYLEKTEGKGTVRDFEKIMLTKKAMVSFKTAVL